MEMGILFFLFLLLSDISIAEDDCSNSSCSKDGPLIRFPFRLNGRQPDRCGYPGFDLICSTDQTKTILDLQSWGMFFVRGINYATQEIRIYDPDQCLARRLLSPNLSGSPFVGYYYLNYTFLNCSAELTRSRFTPIKCLSSSTNTVVATSSMSLAGMMSSMCRNIATVSVPVPWPLQFDGFSSDLSDDLRLTWDSPDCGDCETRGGRCTFKSNSSLEVGCFDIPIQGSSTTKQSPNRGIVVKVIALVMVAPAIACAIALACYMCLWNKCGVRVGAHNPRQEPVPAALSQQPTVMAMGLDEPTIESYTKLVLGESRRLPGPNNRICPICLSDYRPKEILRCIPECQHCFHADCIDAWLRMRATCPVCRNSPSPANAT